MKPSVPSRWPRVFLAAAMAAVFAGQAAMAADPPAAAFAPLTVVLDDNYPPYVFRDADGRLKGILPDQWDLWQKKTGVKVDLKAMDWGEAQRVMREGQADVIDTIFRTPEREQVLAFTRPYARIEVPVYSHRTLGGIADVSSLHGFTVGVKAGDAVVDQLRSHGIDSLQEYPSYEAIVLAAKNEDIKVFSVDEPAAVYFMVKHGVADEFVRSFVLYTGEFHRAVQKTRPDLLKQVEAGFGRITRREYRAIDRKWLGSSILFDVLWIRWRFAILGGLGVILLLAAGNAILGRLVHARTAELRRAMEDLRQSRNRIESIFKVAPVGLGVLHQRRILEANDTLCRITGYSREDIVGLSTRSLYPSQAEYERVGRLLYEQIARDGVGSLEIVGRRRDGTTAPWLIGGAPLDSAVPETGIIISALDITDRKRAEEDLRISHAYFSAVFDGVHDALFIHDSQTFRVLDVNRRMLEMYGFATREEALETFNAMTGGTPPYSMDDAFRWMTKARDEGPQIFEWLARHRDGHPFWIEISIRREQLGPDDRLVVAGRDVTERKKAEEEHRVFERRMQEAQKIESLGMLAGGIAHDFNNLLAAIMGNIDVALLSIPKDSPARDDILAAIVATRRAADLVQQMLAYSGRSRFVPEPLDLAAMVRGQEESLRVSLPPRATLRVHLPDSLPPLDADPSQLKQALANLVANAAEALEGRPGEIAITAGILDAANVSGAPIWPREPLPDGPLVHVDVADTGIGIAPDRFEKIFDPFYSTKFTGRGLGLCAVLGIVRGHKGAVQIESALGKGTTVRLLFPARPGTPPA